MVKMKGNVPGFVMDPDIERYAKEQLTMNIDPNAILRASSGSASGSGSASATATNSVANSVSIPLSDKDIHDYDISLDDAETPTLRAKRIDRWATFAYTTVPILTAKETLFGYKFI
jgi:hypothetical protein